MELFINFLAFALYLTVAALVRSYSGTDTKKVSLIVIKTVWFGALVSHSMAIAPFIFIDGRWNLTFFNAASVTALLIATTLFFSCLRQRLEILAIFILPFVAFILLFGFFTSEKIALTSPNLNFGVQTHIITSLIAYGVLILTAATATLLRIQDTYLHRGDTHRLLTTLPSLERSEIFLFHLLSLGLSLLTLSLISGWIYLEDLFAQHMVHKTILSVVAWFILISLLVGHLLFGWRGNKFLRFLLSGTGLLIIAYFGSKVVLEFILHRA